MSGEHFARPSPSAGRHAGPLPLEAVITTDELRRRPAREPDHAAENQALTALLESLGRADGSLLHELAQRALELCRAHSAGVSLLAHEDGQPVLRWSAVAGRWAVHRGRTTPRGHSPCDAVLERNAPLLLDHPERHYGHDHDSPLDPPAAEALLVPFHFEGRAAGTLWVVAHDATRRFDGEDLRLLTGLARFGELDEQVLERDRLAAQLATRRLIDEERTAELAGMRRLQELSLRLIQSNDGETLYQSVVDAACEIMRSECASLQLLVPERSELKLLVHRGFEPECAAAWGWVGPSTATVCGLALHRKERVIAPDLETFPPLAGSPSLEHYRRSDIRAVQSTPLLSLQGQVLGMLSTHWRRVTRPSEDDLRLIDVLARLAAHLLERVQAEQALREADQRKTQFLALLAHELRNPLASMHSALQIVRGADERDELQSAAGIMDRQLGQLVRLVDDLLDISRISRGRFVLRKERIDLAAVLHQAVETMEPMCKQLDQTLSIELPEQPLPVDGDKARLAQVFANLLDNACKYSERGRPIRLIARAEPRENSAPGEAGAPGEAVVIIRDEGIGIAHDQLTRIFEMFAQVDTSLERSQGGLGLGLTLVKSVVEMHGGRVEAHSDGHGKGSEFVVRLPRAAAPEAGPGPTGPAEGGAPAAAGRQRILVVDDNHDAADSLAMLLRNSGHATQAAYSGAEALAAGESFRPSVILLDLGMPNMNGYETCRRIRALPWGATAVMIAQTGWAQDEDKALTEECGFQAHLTKPVALADLEKLLAEAPASRSDR